MVQQQKIDNHLILNISYLKPENVPKSRPDAAPTQAPIMKPIFILSQQEGPLAL